MSQVEKTGLWRHGMAARSFDDLQFLRVYISAKNSF